MTEPSKPEPAGVIAATEMFVEVLVIGIGSLTAVTGIFAAVIGHEQLQKAGSVLTSTPASAVGLAFSYALGIVVDRGADYILKSTRRRLRSRHFSTNASYDLARRSIVGESHIMAMADYARSRMRICRGWLINSFLLTVAADLLIWRFPVHDRALLLVVSSTAGAVIGSGFYASWRNITLTGYGKLAQQADALQPVIPSQVQAVSQGQ